MKLFTVTLLALVAVAYCEDSAPADVELIEPINSAAPRPVAGGPKPAVGDDKKTAKRGAYYGIGLGYGYGSYYGGYGGYYPYYGHYYDHYYYPHYGYSYGYGYPYWGGYYF